MTQSTINESHSRPTEKRSTDNPVPLPRVLHAPLEIAGQVALSAYGLRGIGIKSNSFARRHPYSFQVEPDIIPRKGRLGWWRAAIPAMYGHDVFHFYYGQSFISQRTRALDARLLRRSGRKVVVEFVGSDIRMPSLETMRNPHYVALDGEDDKQALTRMRTWSRITNGHVIISDPALATFLGSHFDHVHIVPLRVDTHRYATTSPPNPHVKTPVIVHAPSDYAGKGTRYVRVAVQSLRSAGINLEYVELNGHSNREVRDSIGRADIVVDQLCSGSYGVFAAEAMSAGKPVVCYLHPDTARGYPTDLPIINAEPETLAGVLTEWLGEPEKRCERAARSREYARRVHDVRVVAKRLLDVYAALDD